MQQAALSGEGATTGEDKERALCWSWVLGTVHQVTAHCRMV